MASSTVDLFTVFDAIVWQVCCEVLPTCSSHVPLVFDVCVCECSAAIEHCNLLSSSWHGQTVHISPIPISDNNFMCLTLQTLSAFVVRCGDC